MSAALAVGVLGAGMFTVYQIERRQVEQNLRADARNAAVNLSTAGERDRAADDGASAGLGRTRRRQRRVGIRRRAAGRPSGTTTSFAPT